MALLLLKLPFSRTCPSLVLLSKSKALITPTTTTGETWSSNIHIHSQFRIYATSKYGNIQQPQKKKKRKRLDEICLERFQQYSRTYIQSWILQVEIGTVLGGSGGERIRDVGGSCSAGGCGKVLVDGKVVNKAGTPISDKAVVEIKAEVPKYVCRAGYKLEAALEQLNIDVSGKLAMDAGLSTGGFTDCLLQHGASFVYGVDVGYGQVADKIRQDERVSVIERTNLRYLSGLPQKVDLVTLDLSFISILLVMPAVVNVMKSEAILVTLVKPQFEARRAQMGRRNIPLVLIAKVHLPKSPCPPVMSAAFTVPKHVLSVMLFWPFEIKSLAHGVGGGGIVRDPLVHQEVLERIIKGVENFGFCTIGWIESPLKGAEGNTEFLDDSL
ncbi:hypothetical protein IFM89_020173 [Coptis chinensis]|uniref:Ribosomal RNA methyltransferase FtsJ domain-containing protein n=1 Tax=Coptis chinensis TaxID=261450 RepID=A0A835LIP0_9MAGN|nr:hypothetical protein IFM89_020173 [Coptis chinensis]